MSTRAHTTRTLTAGAGVLVAMALLVGGGGGGCQFIVSDAVPAYTCRGNEPGVCPEGQYCNGAGCAPCETKDVCDGRDNDCNGLVDDGADSDGDGDGFTACGVSSAGGAFERRDCSDEDRDVFPGAPEKCNGKDDDCDGAVDEQVCPEASTCAPRSGTCVPDATACDAVARPCPAPQVCDPGTRQCVTKDSARLGDACSSDVQCDKGNFCGYAAALTAAVVKAGPGACTRACCSSSDCPVDSLCYSFGTGGNYCIDKAILQRDKLGTQRGGERCSTGAVCRSGACGPDGRCEDVCCTDRGCAAPTLCRAVPLGEHTVLACSDPAGATAAPRTTCSATLKCERGVCTDLDQLCYSACCGSAACGTVDDGVPRAVVCDDVNPLGQPRDVVPACRALNGGTKALGEPCAEDKECRGVRCYPDATGTKYCSDVCCTDADCAPAGLVCRPRDLNRGRFFLRCVRK